MIFRNFACRSPIRQVEERVNSLALNGSVHIACVCNLCRHSNPLKYRATCVAPFPFDQVVGHLYSAFAINIASLRFQRYLPPRALNYCCGWVWIFMADFIVGGHSWLKALRISCVPSHHSQYPSQAANPPTLISNVVPPHVPSARGRPSRKTTPPPFRLNPF